MSSEQDDWEEDSEESSLSEDADEVDLPMLVADPVMGAHEVLPQSCCFSYNTLSSWHCVGCVVMFGVFLYVRWCRV